MPIWNAEKNSWIVNGQKIHANEISNLRQMFREKYGSEWPGPDSHLAEIRESFLFTGETCADEDQMIVEEMRNTTGVQAHPATDTWMRGDRFGTIERIGRKYIHVRMDKSGRLVRFTPDNLLEA